MLNTEHTRFSPIGEVSSGPIVHERVLNSARCFLIPAVVLCIIAMLSGCAARGPAPVGGWDWSGPVPDGYYLVRKGDTLSELAVRRGVSLKTLASWNGLQSPYNIYAGRLLRIEPPDGAPVPQPTRGASVAATGSPPASSPAAVRPPAPTQTQTRPQPQTSPGAPAGPSKTSDGRSARDAGAASGTTWAWPLGGSVVQTFSGGDRTRQGIRIRGRAGEPVHSAADGQVVYSGGGLTGYGNLIIVKHNDKYLSAYGFNRRLLVDEGDRVKRGQAVAEVGEAVEGGGYLLHFEIRRDGTAVDPLLYLPPRK